MSKFLSALALVIFCAVRLQAATLWDESVNGDLSNNKLAPTPFVLSLLGTNSFIGSVGGGDSQDWIRIAVPLNRRVTAVVLKAYSSPDPQGFTGFQVGNTFLGDPFTAGSYAGYAHFGTGAQNGPLPPANLVGANLLPIMASPVTAPGATGFSGVLDSAQYTFLFQQLGSATTYQFDFITQVPEPSSLALLSCGVLMLARHRRSLK